MPALSVSVPFPVFQDRDGQPLDNGYVYIGAANLDAQTNPVQVYFDEALTIPAAQPLRTINGYVSNVGTPAQLYVNGVNFSIKVLDAKGTFVYSFSNGTGINASASGVSYLPAGTGAVLTTVQTKLRESVSVKDFGAVGDGVTDDAAAIQAADAYADTARVPVFFPPGSYRVKSTIVRVSQAAWFGPSQQSNANINNEVQIFGTVSDIGNGNPMIRCAATGVTTSVSSLSFENLEFVSDKSVDFANLSATTSSGITLVDVSNVKNGLEFIGCSFKNAAFGIRQSDGDPYLDKVTLDRCHFTLLYKAIQCNPTGGLSLTNCFVYDCFDWVYTKSITGTRSNGAEVLLNACSFNNSSFAAEYTCITASAIVATSCWFEGGNHWLHATKYAKAEGCYFSEAYSASGSTKFSMAPNDPDVNSCTFVSVGNRIATNTRLIDLSLVTNETTISVVCIGNYDGSNFSDEALVQTKIQAGINYQGFGNVNTLTWNIAQGTARNAQNANYTLTEFDAGKLIFHSSASTHTWTIPSNASVPFPLGTEIVLYNETGGGAVTVAITADTLRYLALTGSRALAANGTAVLRKVSDTVWRLTGEGIT